MSKNIQSGTICVIRGAMHEMNDGGWCRCTNGRIVEIKAALSKATIPGWMHSPVQCIKSPTRCDWAAEAVLFPIIDPNAVRAYDREHQFDDLDSDAVRERMLKMWSLS